MLTALSVLIFVCACSHKNTQEEYDSKDSLSAVDGDESVASLGQDALDWDADDYPMPMYAVHYFDTDYHVTDVRLRHLFSFDKQKAYYKLRAANYTQMMCADKVVKIAYKGIHEGPEMGNWIGGAYADYMSGLDYECKGVWEEGFAFTDQFMKTHEIVSVKNGGGKAPKDVVDSLQARYGMKVHSLQKCTATKDGKMTVYWGQMKPQGSKCLGMCVVKVNGKLLVDEAWTDQYDEGSAWNVDDGGEYISIDVVGVTHSDKGYDIFYRRGAPESFRHGVLLVRDNKIIDHEFCTFYNYIDYQPSTDDAADE